MTPKQHAAELFEDDLYRVVLRACRDYATNERPDIGLRNAIGHIRQFVFGCMTEERNAERRRIAEWLRRDSTAESEPAAWDYAAEIEEGDYAEADDD